MSHYRMTHTRSASWSPQRELLESSLSEPLRNVLREYVPSALIQNGESTSTNQNTATVNVGDEEEEREHNNNNSPGYLDFTACLSLVKKVLPFVVLMLLRWVWEHRTGL